MRDQVLFDKIDLHLIRVLHTVLTERSVSRAALRLGHVPACRVGGAQAPARTVGRPASGALGRRHGAHGCGPAHDRAQCKHSACRRGPVHRRPRLRPADRHQHVPRRRRRLPRSRMFLPQLVSQDEVARRRCARSRSIRSRPPPTTTPSWRKATSTWWWATGSSRPKTCTWASCSRTRSSAWCPTTIRPRARGWTARKLAGGRAHRAHAHPPRRPRRDRRVTWRAWAWCATSRRAARTSG